MNPKEPFARDFIPLTVIIHVAIIHSIRISKRLKAFQRWEFPGGNYGLLKWMRPISELLCRRVLYHKFQCDGWHPRFFIPIGCFGIGWNWNDSMFIWILLVCKAMPRMRARKHQMKWYAMRVGRHYRQSHCLWNPSPHICDAFHPRLRHFIMKNEA